jgi:hypothetical protein
MWWNIQCNIIAIHKNCIRCRLKCKSISGPCMQDLVRSQITDTWTNWLKTSSSKNTYGIFASNINVWLWYQCNKNLFVKIGCLWCQSQSNWSDHQTWNFERPHIPNTKISCMQISNSYLHIFRTEYFSYQHFKRIAL